jgi:hypothetical protein
MPADVGWRLPGRGAIIKLDPPGQPHWLSKPRRVLLHLRLVKHLGAASFALARFEAFG